MGVFTFLFFAFAVYNFFSVKILKNDYSNVFGYTVFEVVSGSMSPAIEKWDIILVKLDEKDYRVGDIISYKSEGVYVTHRIVEKNGDTFVTKGDANNTIDAPINKGAIAGKVVKVYRHIGAWVKVFTTPKIMFFCFLSIALLVYTVSMFKKDKKEHPEKTKKTKKEAVFTIKVNSRLKFELFTLLILLLALIVLVPYTLSRFRTEASGDAVIDVAFFVVDDKYDHEDITLTSMEPGDSYTYTFSVSNFKEDGRTEVTTSYFVDLLATTNLPLDYELYLINSGINQNIVDTSEIITDDNGTYFKNMKTSSRNFGFDVNQTDYYKLIVKFPEQYKAFKYQGVAENIEIRIRGKQILNSDN
jgi:signal peptidase